MLQTSLLLMKSLNKTETPIFLSVVCFFFQKTIFFTFISDEEVSCLWPYFFFLLMLLQTLLRSISYSNFPKDHIKHG